MGPGVARLEERPRQPGPCLQEQHNRKLQEQWEELSSQVRALSQVTYASPSPLSQVLMSSVPSFSTMEGNS